jgi:hypothetical protein
MFNLYNNIQPRKDHTNVPTNQPHKQASKQPASQKPKGGDCAKPKSAFLTFLVIHAYKRHRYVATEILCRGLL